MTDLTPVLEEKKLRLLKEYPSEILVGILIICILGLWGKLTGVEGKMDSMQGKIDALQIEQKTYLNVDRKEMLQVVSKNTDVMNNIADYLRMRETREALKN